VRLERIGAALVVSPSGFLDGTQAGRLRDVLESRARAHATVVLDLRELVGVGDDGLELLEQQVAQALADGIDLVVVAGPAARASLAGLDRGGELRVVDDIDEVLEPHRAEPRANG